MSDDAPIRWKIVDRRTGHRGTINSYPTETAALEQIEAWKRRHAAGGRPDITMTLLENLQPEPESR